MEFDFIEQLSYDKTYKEFENALLFQVMSYMYDRQHRMSIPHNDIEKQYLEYYFKTRPKMRFILSLDPIIYKDKFSKLTVELLSSSSASHSASTSSSASKGNKIEEDIIDYGIINYDLIDTTFDKIGNAYDTGLMHGLKVNVAAVPFGVYNTSSNEFDFVNECYKSVMFFREDSSRCSADNTKNRNLIKLLEDDIFNFCFIPDDELTDEVYIAGMKKYIHLIREIPLETIRRNISTVIDIIISAKINSSELNKLLEDEDKICLIDKSLKYALNTEMDFD